jgi:polysaccharide biosynthesis/export protein
MNKFTYIILLLFLGGISSCGLNTNLMFKEAKDDTAKTDSIPLRPENEYTISKDDKFTFQLYTKNGEGIINGMTGIKDDATSKPDVEYVVRQDGTAELPIIGSLKVAGLTVQKCEDTLAKLYEISNGYINPYVQVKLTNQRVIVFPGSGSDAKVIPLQNNNTTLMEVIALAGGIAERGKANTVKLIRSENNKRVVYRMDLSTIEGLKYSDMIVQANDYIYIEPSEQISKQVVASTAPIVSLLSSIFVILTVALTLK